MSELETENMVTMATTHASGFEVNGQEKETPREISEHQESQTSAAESGVQNSNQEASKKEKKKKKKSKKNNGNMRQCKENFFDNTMSNEGMSQQKSCHEAQERDFTPLREKLGASFFEDADSSEDEGMPDYKVGGYHPVHVGELLMSRYIIIQKLGWGHFSTVWLAKDIKTDSYVAMKCQKSAQHYLEAAYDEVAILDQIASNWKTDEWNKSIRKYYKDDVLEWRYKKFGMTSEMSHCAQLLNSFVHNGTNGKHFIMVFEILGVNFLEIIKRYEYKGVPIPLVKRLAKQCLIGLDYMHRVCNLIHTDFKPENVVIALTDDQLKEIARTGQLTSSKQNEIRKKFNMKVAGTLPKEEKPSVQVLDDPRLDGLTGKQRQNMRKKLQRLRKKGREQSSIKGSELGQETVMKDISNESKKKRVAAGSLDFGNHPNEIKGVLDVDKQEEAEAKEERGPGIDEDVRVMICDMGNGCWKYHHFTPEIQTRQYRSPEVIIGGDYNTSADLWSFACTIFEMVTGDFLFEPRNGQNYDKDDDHLAQMMELLGQMPETMAVGGKASNKYFNSKGELRRIQGLNYWPLEKVLVEKYRIKEDEAKLLAEFLIPMLDWVPEKRATAEKMLDHPWLTSESSYNYKYSDREYEVMMLKKQMEGGASVKGGRCADEEQRPDMNTVLESDVDNYVCDREDNDSLFSESSELDLDCEMSASFCDSEEDEERKQWLKSNTAKVNNSFTGPYPMDPTDFDHTDKGGNQQFANLEL